MAHLPKIYGVRHRMENLERAKRMIDVLPKRSLVGLEMDLPPHQDAAFQQKYPFFCRAHENAKGFFTLLAEHAQSRGHEVVWLERPAFSMAGQKQVMAELEEKSKAAVEKLEQRGLFPTQTETEAFQEAILRFKCSIAVQDHLRSKIMADQIVRRNAKNVARRWRTSDLVLVGAVHALQVAEKVSAKVKYIGSSHEEARESSDFFKQAYARTRAESKAARRHKT